MLQSSNDVQRSMESHYSPSRSLILPETVAATMQSAERKLTVPCHHWPCMREHQSTRDG